MRGTAIQLLLAAALVVTGAALVRQLGWDVARLQFLRQGAEKSEASLSEIRGYSAERELFGISLESVSYLVLFVTNGDSYSQDIAHWNQLAHVSPNSVKIVGLCGDEQCAERSRASTQRRAFPLLVYSQPVTQQALYRVREQRTALLVNKRLRVKHEIPWPVNANAFRARLDEWLIETDTDAL
jgi:hypothetical protein